jgi:hypothetical protein
MTEIEFVMFLLIGVLLPTDLCVRAVPLAFEHLRPELCVLPDRGRAAVAADERLLHTAFRQRQVFQRTPSAEASQRIGRVDASLHDRREVAERPDKVSDGVLDFRLRLHVADRLLVSDAGLAVDHIDLRGCVTGRTDFSIRYASEMFVVGVYGSVFGAEIFSFSSTANSK